MPTRLHKVVFSPLQNIDHFQHLKFPDKRSTNITEQAKLVNPEWPDYSDEICIQTTALGNANRPVPLAGGKSSFTQYLVLRGHLKCACCSGACVHAHDHAVAQKTVLGDQTARTMGAPADRAHGPGEGYIESTADLHTLQPVLETVTQKLAAGGAASIAKELSDEAALFGLTSDEIQAHLHQDAGIDFPNGEAARVLAGTATDPMSYTWVASFLKLWRRLLERSHSDLTTTWPQQMRHKEVRLV